MSDIYNTLSDFDDNGKPVKSRVATCEQAQQIAQRFLRDDAIRADRRVKVQGMFDGNAQKRQSDMIRAGRGNDANLNWREHKGHIINAWIPYFDLRSEVPVCIDANLETEDPVVAQELVRGFAEYFHELLFNSENFDVNTQLCDLQMILHGIGTKVWENEYDWRPKSVLASNIYVPDTTNAQLDNCEMIMITSTWSVSMLWDKIKDPAVAKAMNWNVAAVKKAIMQSTNADSQLLNWKWDRWEQALKNGDIYISQTQTKRIDLCTLFVKELDGEGGISQKIFTLRPDANNGEFLYDCPAKYTEWSNVLTAFTYDIGADGTWHSIKGLGTEIYAFCALLNNVKNSMADLVVTGIKPMWQAETTAQIEEFKMIKWGGGNLVPKGIMPLSMNIGSNLNPALAISQQFNETLSRNVGAYNASDVAAPTVEETAKSAMIRASERSKMTKGAHNRYMRSCDKEYRETWRRAVNPNIKPWHSGGPEALEFQRRCYALCDKFGVPHSVLQEVTNVRANRSLGLGSAGMRIEIANQLMQNIAQFDEIGQNEIKRMFVATMTSFHSVDAIVPSLGVTRDATNDEAVAAQENNAFNILMQQAEAVVVPLQNHSLHLQSHLASIKKDIDMCNNGQEDPQICVNRIMSKIEHSGQHLNYLMQSPTKRQMANEVKQNLADAEEFASEVQQSVDADAANQEEIQAQQKEQDIDQMKAEFEVNLKEQKQAAALNLKEEKHQFEMKMKSAKADFDKALLDAKTASEISRKNRVADSSSMP